MVVLTMSTASSRLILAATMVATLLVFPVPTSQAAFPGSNGRIAYASNIDGDSEIYTINADGSGMTQLTFNTDQDTSPSWSPDGKWVAFESDRGGTSGEIFTMRANGTQVRSLTGSPGQDIDPAWSPNGEMIVFTSDRGADGDFDIYTMRSDGRSERRITQNTDDDQDAAWSPNGKLIAFESDRLSTDHIFRMRPDGSRVRQVTPAGIFASYDPAWSPNGKWLAYSMHDGTTSGYELWKSHVDGSGLTNLSNTGSSVQDFEAAWSPQGDKIVLVDDFDGDRELVVRNSNGSVPVQITFNGSDDREPNWQPR